MSTKYTCCGRISLGAFYGSKLCGKTAKFDRDGKHYCGTHDPVTIAEKDAIKNAAWKAKYEAIHAARDAAKAKQAEIERRADCYTELLEALQRLVLNANGDAVTGYFDVPVTNIEAAKAAITKALGAQA